jgi:hypothetical protein
MINLFPLVSTWSLLAAVVIGLIIYRWTISSHEDDTLHVLDKTATTQQKTVAHKLEVIDKWGKILTVIALLYGLVVAAVYFFNVWNSLPTY